MDLRPCSLLLLWTLVVALALLAREVLAQRVYTNTWAVLVPAGPREADRLAEKHGFLNLGPVSAPSLSPAAVPSASPVHRKLHNSWLQCQDLAASQLSASGCGVGKVAAQGAARCLVPSVREQPWARGAAGQGAPGAPSSGALVGEGGRRGAVGRAGAVQPSRAAAEHTGVRMLDGEVTDAVEAHSLGLNPNHIHIYSASWGPEDDGKTVDGPARLAEEAFFRGVSQGRGGLGSIFVWASGNGGREHDSCNCDGYTNSIYTLSISSTTQYGNVPWYSEACSSTLATTYSSGNQNEKQIVTTDLRQKCTESHTGTSASAPLAAGIIALALEANKNLTWRDMQHLVVQTSKPAHLNANDWVTNGVGRKVSHSYGYGLLDAGAMVSLAKNWTTVGPQRKCVIDILTEPKDIGKRLEVRRKVDACLGKANYISRLEHAQARLTLSYNRRGDLAIHLVSPMGTRSTLLASRPHDYSADGFNDWAFMTTHSWDEDPAGDWVLEIENTSDANNYGTLTKFTLVLYGTATDSPGLSNQLESSGCKTLTSSQTCVVCEEGYYLHQKSCLKRCPPGFAPGVQSTHYALENGVEPISPHLCLPCHPSCATCSGPTANECLTCPAHSHFSSLDLSCSHQTQSSRASPALADGEGLAEAPPPANLPVLIASLSCVLIVIIFVTVFLALQLRSGFSLRGVKVYALDSGIISYKGLPSDVWQEEGPSESDGEEYEAHSERTAFIRDQSAL
uniref:furin n=1 Tax=Dromaius novaehollandiae TaxID=8790 RepID=A0A8C4JSY2_DRONO